MYLHISLHLWHKWDFFHFPISVSRPWSTAQDSWFWWAKRRSCPNTLPKVPLQDFLADRCLLYWKSSCGSGRCLVLHSRTPPSLPTPSQFTWLPTKFFMHYKMLMLIHTAAEKQGPRYLPDSVTLHSTGHRPRSPLQVSAHPPAAASLWVVAFQPLCSAPCRRAAPRCHLPPPVKGSVPGAAVPGADCTSLWCPEKQQPHPFFRHFSFVFQPIFVRQGTKSSAFFSSFVIPFLFSICKCNSHRDTAW